MPTKATLTLLLTLLPATLPAQDKFALVTLFAPQPSGPHQVLLSVQTTGPAPTLQPADWRVVASHPPAPDILLPVLASSPQPGVGFDLTVDTTALGRTSLGQLAWSLSIPSLPALGAATIPATPASTKPKHLFAAKGKADADLYAFGSILAGVGTKPLYVIDAKASPAWEQGASGWFLGLNAAITANQTVTPPVSRSSVDPDSVTGAFEVKKELKYRHQGGTRTIDTYVLHLRPLAGEFSRKYPASDLITAGSLAWHPKNIPLNPQLGFTLYPAIGYEVGKNLNQPHILFTQPVDLTRWSAIARLAPSATAALYVLPHDASNPDAPYPFTVTATYQPRIPLTLEPFVTTVGSGTTATQLTTLRKNTRHEVEASAAWNFTQFFGLALNYRYGSLPPLFQFVDHQVTVGLTFKGSFSKKK